MTLVAIRQRLLEGVLLRLAQLPNAGGIVLRGGMLLQHWFRPTPRVVLDLDLVAPSPLTVADAANFHSLFADHVSDGVTFDTEDIQVEGIWLQSENPGIRMLVRGECDGLNDDIQVDITGGPPPIPEPVMTELPMSSGVVRLWACRPEAIVGQKIQALWHLGMLGWRPKDLDDLGLLLERMPMQDRLMQDAISAAFAELGGNGSDARGVFSPQSWWNLKHASARWGDFVSHSNRKGVRNLSNVVAKIAARLKPILEELP